MLRSELITKLRQTARKQNKTYQDVCLEAGVYRQALWQWMRRRSNPSLENFIAVAETLGFDVVLMKKEK